MNEINYSWYGRILIEHVYGSDHWTCKWCHDEINSIEGGLRIRNMFLGDMRRMTWFIIWGQWNDLVRYEWNQTQYGDIHYSWSVIDCIAAMTTPFGSINLLDESILNQSYASFVSCMYRWYHYYDYQRLKWLSFQHALRSKWSIWSFLYTWLYFISQYLTLHALKVV